MCFANAAIQVLRAARCRAECGDWKCMAEKKVEAKCMACQMSLALRRWPPVDTAQLRSGLLRNICELSAARYTAGQQHDSAEFLSDIANLIPSIRRTFGIDVQENITCGNSCCSYVTRRHYRRRQKPGDNPPWSTLDLNCVKTEGEEGAGTPLTSMSACLARLIRAPSEVSDWKCEKCGNEGGTQCFQINHLPSAVCVNLKRFRNIRVPEGHALEALWHGVAVPELLSGEALGAPPAQHGHVYALIAVTAFEGATPKCGHWVCRVRRRLEQQGSLTDWELRNGKRYGGWHHCSDTKITRLGEADDVVEVQSVNDCYYVFERTYPELTEQEEARANLLACTVADQRNTDEDRVLQAA